MFNKKSVTSLYGTAVPSLVYLLLLFDVLCVNFTNGSHWRFGQISWKVTTGTTVEFTAQIGWRTGAIGTETFTFGDGSTISLSGSQCSEEITPCPSDSTSVLYHQVLSVTTDLSGASATLIQYIFYHTYPSYLSYTYGLASCCRVGDLIVGSNDDYDYYGVVALANGNSGSPVSGLPPVVQFPNGISTVIDISPVDNDGDDVTCRAALSTESGISDNSFYTIDSTACTITMGELGSIGDKWAIQVIMETTAGDSVPIDFALEATDPTKEAPQCNLITSTGTDGSYSVNVGETLTVEMSGTDGDSSSLNVQSVSLPSGSSISPTGSQSTPVSIYFTWTPSSEQQGSFSASVQVSDDDSQSDICIIPIMVKDEQITQIVTGTFTPDMLSSSFGDVTNLRDDISVVNYTGNNVWYVVGSGTVEPISMGLRTTLYAGTDCNPTKFTIDYDAFHTSTEGDGAIIISAGSEYLSFMFDFDGGVIVNSAYTAGTAIYPGCGSTTLPQFANGATDSSALFTDDQDTNPTNDNSFYNWRDGMAGGNRDNWQVFNSARVGNQAGGFSVGFDMSDTDMTITFSAGTYIATCTMNTIFSFNNGNDVLVDFSPDYDSNERWYINSITATTDCSAGTNSPSNAPSDIPTPSPSPNPSNNPTPSPSPNPTPSPSPNPTQSPSPNPTPSPSPLPTYMPTPGCAVDVCPTPCNDDPCECVVDQVEACIMNTCHPNGCGQCMNGYFKKDYNYPCTQCQEVFSDACLHCTDFLGCQQCIDGVARVYDPDCGLYFCDYKNACDTETIIYVISNTTTTEDGGSSVESGSPSPTRSPTEEPTTNDDSNTNPCEDGYFIVDSVNNGDYNYLLSTYTDSGDETVDGTPIYESNTNNAIFYQNSNGDYIFESPDGLTFFTLPNTDTQNLNDVAGTNTYDVMGGGNEGEVNINILVYDCDGNSITIDTNTCDTDCIDISGMIVDGTTDAGTELNAFFDSNSINLGSNSAFNGRYCYDDATGRYEREIENDEVYSASLYLSNDIPPLITFEFDYYDSRYYLQYREGYNVGEDFACDEAIDNFFDSTSATGVWDLTSDDFEDLNFNDVTLDNPTFEYDDCVGVDFYCGLGSSANNLKVYYFHILFHSLLFLFFCVQIS